MTQKKRQQINRYLKKLMLLSSQHGRSSVMNGPISIETVEAGERANVMRKFIMGELQ